MSTRRRSVRPVLDTLESRLALSTVSPLPPPPSADTIGSQVVHLHPRQITSANLPIHPVNLNPVKYNTLIRLAADPTPGSAANPRFLGATNANGKPLRFIQGGHYIPGIRPRAQAFTFVHNTSGVNALVTSNNGASGGAVVSNSLPGDLNGDGKVNTADLALFQSAWLTTPADAFYNPAADLNHNGFVGQGDAKLMERNVTPITPKAPLQVSFHLAPGQTAVHPGISNSGAVTNQIHVTVLGHTTPRSIILSDSGLGDYTFIGAMAYANDKGNFAFTFTMKPTDALKNTDYLVIDPYGQQIVQDFPIVYVAYSKPNY